jgi:uncharacterized phiE125 gp8 family phage protein
MSTRMIVPPAAMAVSIEAARRSARASGTSLDDELSDKVQAYTEEAEHKTRRAFITQTWAVTLDEFPAAIKLAHPPIVNVLSVQFYDIDGTSQTLDPQDYQVDNSSEPGYIVPAPGRTWPETAQRINAVEVQYTCGYGESPDAVPAAIRQYILGMVENDYYPSPGAQYLPRLLERAKVYG